MADTKPDCAWLLKISALEPPSAAYVTRLDVGLCVAVCAVYLVVLQRFLTWVHGLLRRSEASLRNAILYAIFTSVGIYVLIGLPVLWLRNAILTRNLQTLEGGKRLCRKNSTCVEPCVNIRSLLLTADLIHKHKPPDTALRTLVYVLAGALVLLAVIVSLHGRSQAIRLTERQRRTQRRTLANPRSPHRGNTWYDITVVDKKSAGNNEEEDTCVVCISDLWARKVCQLPCQHRFHAACIQRWLSKAYRPICPLCLVEVRVLNPRNKSRCNSGSGLGIDIGEGEEDVEEEDDDSLQIP